MNGSSSRICLIINNDGHQLTINEKKTRDKCLLLLSCIDSVVSKTHNLEGIVAIVLTYSGPKVIKVASTDSYQNAEILFDLILSLRLDTTGESYQGCRVIEMLGALGVLVDIVLLHSVGELVYERTRNYFALNPFVKSKLSMAPKQFVFNPNTVSEIAYNGPNALNLPVTLKRMTFTALRASLLHICTLAGPSIYPMITEAGGNFEWSRFLEKVIDIYLLPTVSTPHKITALVTSSFLITWAAKSIFSSNTELEITKNVLGIYDKPNGTFEPTLGHHQLSKKIECLGKVRLYNGTKNKQKSRNVLYKIFRTIALTLVLAILTLVKAIYSNNVAIIISESESSGNLVYNQIFIIWELITMIIYIFLDKSFLYVAYNCGWSLANRDLHLIPDTFARSHASYSVIVYLFFYIFHLIGSLMPVFTQKTQMIPLLILESRTYLAVQLILHYLQRGQKTRNPSYVASSPKYALSSSEMSHQIDQNMKLESLPDSIFLKLVPLYLFFFMVAPFDGISLFLVLVVTKAFKSQYISALKSSRRIVPRTLKSAMLCPNSWQKPLLVIMYGSFLLGMKIIIATSPDLLAIVSCVEIITLFFLFHFKKGSFKDKVDTAERITFATVFNKNHKSKNRM